MDAGYSPEERKKEVTAATVEPEGKHELSKRSTEDDEVESYENPGDEVDDDEDDEDDDNEDSASDILPPPPRDFDDDTYGFSTDGTFASRAKSSKNATPDAPSGATLERVLSLPKSPPKSPPPSPPPLPDTPATITTIASLTSGKNVVDATRPTDYKTKINQRLSRSLATHFDYHPDASQRRSPDLVPLKKKYQTFRKKLRTLISAMKEYKTTMAQMQSARNNLFEEFKDLSVDTPLFDHVGQSLEGEELQTLLQKQPAVVGTVVAGSPNKKGLELFAEPTTIPPPHGALSLTAIQQLAHNMHERINTEEFDKYLLAYATEWEDIVTHRLDEEIQQVDQLQRQRLHYERKISGLRKRQNAMERRGKAVAPAFAEKVARNEQKLTTAWETHEERASKLCILLEEVTDHGWKDLYPLIKNTMRFEINKISRDEASYGRLKVTLEAMKQKSFSVTHSHSGSSSGGGSRSRSHGLPRNPSPSSSPVNVPSVVEREASRCSV